jgi:hypothetical protein
MALAQALRSMPVGALLVRFPKQLDAMLGKPPRDPVKSTSKELCVDFSRSWVADAAERGTFNSRLAARSTFSSEWTRISQTSR